MQTIAPTRLIRVIQEPLKTGISITGAASHHTEIGLFFCRMYEGLCQFFGIPNRPDLSKDAHVAARGVIVDIVENVSRNRQQADKVGYTLDFTFINFHTDENQRFRLVNVLDADGVVKIDLQTTNSGKVTNFDKVPGTILDLFLIATEDRNCPLPN